MSAGPEPPLSCDLRLNHAGVAVIAFLETASMIEGDKVEGLAKELFGVIEAKKYKKVLLNLYNAGYLLNPPKALGFQPRWLGGFLRKGFSPFR